MEGMRKAENTDEIFLIGRPVVTIFHNPDNLFTIVKLKIRETNCGYEEKEIIVKGNFPQLTAEEDYKFTGRLVNHPTYGAQFDVHSHLLKRCLQQKQDLFIIYQGIYFQVSG